eukprot:m.234304 g.234304  ORF g.234304 m.234304 type:complete len:626 (-) comp19545_c0_seq1:19-1896(-)
MAEGSKTGAVPSDRQRQRLAELAAELEAARISASPREKQFNWSRPATVSSAMPLSHRDVAISSQQRELFQNLELDVLLSEFQTVAATKEQVGNDDDEPAEKEAPTAEGAAESAWLEEAGFEVIADKFAQGSLITDADLRAETVGFTPAQIHAVKQRVDTLNDTLRRTKKGASKVDVRDLFSEPARSVSSGSPPAAPALDVDVTSRLTVLTDNADEPQTLFFDLSEEDQQQVQCLNLIQVTSILERAASVGKAKRPKKKKKEEHLTFGVRLDSLVERDRVVFKEAMKLSEVPLILTRIVDYLVDRALHEEGIFRKAGSAARIKTLRQVVEDARGDVDFAKLDARAHDVSAVLKQFLREIPEPLLTSECIELFLAVPSLGNTELQLYTLQLLVMLLPRVNRFCLRMLLDFLALVASQHEINKMNIANLAVVFAPTLFYVKGHKGQKMLKEVDTQLTTAATLRLMLEHHHVLWNVPADIVAQVRFVNEQRALGRKASRPKDMKRLLSDKTKTHPLTTAAAGPVGSGDAAGRAGRIKWIKDSSEKPPLRAAIVVLRDGLPIEDVPVYDTTTARTLLETLKAPSDFVLVECGGNIGCRRLDERTRILSLLRVNPLGTIALMSLVQFQSFA